MLGWDMWTGCMREEADPGNIRGGLGDEGVYEGIGRGCMITNKTEWYRMILEQPNMEMTIRTLYLLTKWQGKGRGAMIESGSYGYQ